MERSEKAEKKPEDHLAQIVDAITVREHRILSFTVYLLRNGYLGADQQRSLKAVRRELKLLNEAYAILCRR